MELSIHTEAVTPAVAHFITETRAGVGEGKKALNVVIKASTVRRLQNAKMAR